MSFVRVHEVGPRDGLQNEPGVIAIDRKVALIRALVAAGLSRVEVGSFVSPKWVPQMANTADVMAGLADHAGVRYDVLVPNMKGWDAFADTPQVGIYGIAVFISASEGFSRANLNCSIAESVARIAPVVVAAQKQRVPVRGYVSCVSDCPFDGPVAPQAVACAVELLRDLDPMPISLGDTLGRATPKRVAAMLDAVSEIAPVADLAGHYHNTDGRALENVAVSLDRGLRAFDSAAGGLGGCPYAPGAPGNLATEELVPFLHDHGFETGVDMAKLDVAVRLAQEIRHDAHAD